MLNILEADYSNRQHAADVQYLTNAYAESEMGGGHTLSQEELDKMIAGLRGMSTAFTLLAYSDEAPVGIANCFICFSTFEGQKLINIHDLAVIKEMRGKGIGEKLLEAVQKKARKMNCCKLTLEVRTDNRAINLYERFGFETDDPRIWFMTKEFY
ncbi:MAG: GNAT family N-acetyltransferase [Balneolaceae bacterium]|nr:GNAT family N-acetyltransferase [Balneolaceae bacterium]